MQQIKSFDKSLFYEYTQLIHDNYSQIWNAAIDWVSMKENDS